MLATAPSSTVKGILDTVLVYDSFSNTHPYLMRPSKDIEEYKYFLAKCYLLVNSPLGRFLNQLERFHECGCNNDRLLTQLIALFTNIVTSHKLDLSNVQYTSYLGTKMTNVVLVQFNIIKRVLFACVNNNRRVEPVGVMFHGPAGSGKTTLTSLISEHMMGCVLPENLEITAPYKMSRVACGKQRYWDSYKGETTVIFDDIGQGGLNDFEEIPTLISGMEKKLACAIPENIGSVSFTSKFFFATCNDSILKSLKKQKILDKNAIYRRFVWYDTNDLKFADGKFSGFVRSRFFDVATGKFVRSCKIHFDGPIETQIMRFTEFLFERLFERYKALYDHQELLKRLIQHKSVLTSMSKNFEKLVKTRQTTGKVEFEAQGYAILNSIDCSSIGIPDYTRVTRAQQMATSNPIVYGLRDVVPNNRSGDQSASVYGCNIMQPSIQASIQRAGNANTATAEISLMPASGFMSR